MSNAQEKTATTPNVEPHMPPPPDAPLCPHCRLAPRLWGIRAHTWQRYCGGVNCTNTHRRCMYCQGTVPRDQFRYVKYCSDACAHDAHASRDQTSRGTTIHRCLRCGATSESTKTEPHGWRDGRCSDCWRTRIGADRMGQLILHGVTWDMADAWAEAGWLCSLCDEPVPQRRGAVDHDHDCCPGSRSCGKCVRGYLHHNCNVALGYLRNDPDLCRSAAYYLQNYQDQR